MHALGLKVPHSISGIRALFCFRSCFHKETPKIGEIRLLEVNEEQLNV